MDDQPSCPRSVKAIFYMNLRVLIIILYLHHNSHNEESVDVDVDMYVDMCT